MAMNETTPVAGSAEYPPIADYGVIGDGRTAALVSRAGSIDWLCWPRFDSTALLFRLLDVRGGGFFRVGPVGEARVERAYESGTNVLSTVFASPGGRCRVTDFMVPWVPGNRPPRLYRILEGLEGAIEMEVEFRPSFDWGRANPEVVLSPEGAIARAAGAAVALACPGGLRPGAAGALGAKVALHSGARVHLCLEYAEDEPRIPSPRPGEAEADLAATLRYWREWSSACTYQGPYHELVRRSALALKLLTYEPTGALVAAATTSLPEEIGGVRNWDYRYTWLRDASLIVYVLQAIGYHAEADHFFEWLERLCTRRACELQTMYRVDGGTELPEETLAHLEGYRGSAPVRVGNAASSQFQLDVYGHILDVAHVCFTTLPRPLDAGLWAVLRQAADQAAIRWREPDDGIWEVRGGSRQFVHSKLMCWVALDRALKLARGAGLDGDLHQWAAVRQEIAEAILRHGYDERVGAFTQVLDGSDLDASALVFPLVGFLSPEDPRIRSTVARIEERLVANGLVRRYLGDDGLPGSEGAFAICTFWLVDNLALQGRVDEAREVFELVVAHANDLGLLSEQIDSLSASLLGNFPQGFSHLALIRSAVQIARAEDRERETGRAEKGRIRVPDSVGEQAG